MNETGLEAKFGYYNSSDEFKKISQARGYGNSWRSGEVQGEVTNDIGIVGLLSSSTQQLYGFRSVREDGLEHENSWCSEIL